MRSAYLTISFVVMCLTGCGSSSTDYEASYDDYEMETSHEYHEVENTDTIEDDFTSEEYSETEEEGEEYADSSYTSSYSSYIPTIYTSPITNYNTTYHIDNNYQYEYRTGVSGNYNYNYDVSGTDDYGDDVYGNLDMQGKYGSGYIVNEDGEEVEVEAKWIDYGIIEATDLYGNTYELTAD